MNRAARSGGTSTLGLMARVGLVVAGLAIGAFLVVGYGVAVDLNQAYFNRPDASVSAIEVAAMVLAVYCVLAGLRGRWRIV